MHTASNTQLERTAVSRQATFWRDRLIELSSLQALLRENVPLPKEFQTLMRCRTKENEHHTVCENCGVPHTFDYHCNKRFCPCCAWQISCERRHVLEQCTHLLRSPKHVVLTARNQESLERMFRVVLHGVRQLRRRKVFSQVRGGWCSFEVTNESKGWHVHAHLLIDAPYIDARELAQEWAACVKQDFAIVKIKSARARARARAHDARACAHSNFSGEANFLAELTKYTVKPSVFIKWPHKQRVELVQRIRGKRMFFAFGHVAEAARAVRANIKQSKSIARTKCCVNPIIGPIPKVERRR